MDENEVTLTLVGGPTVLIKVDGLRLLTDPTFDPPRSYPGPTHLQKLAGPAISADVIGAVDAVLLGHEQHFDNFDHAGRAFADKARAILTTTSGAARMGGRSRG